MSNNTKSPKAILVLDAELSLEELAEVGGGFTFTLAPTPAPLPSPVFVPPVFQPPVFPSRPIFGGGLVGACSGGTDDSGAMGCPG